MEKKKIALMFVCLNANYWPFLEDIIEDAKKHFLTKHKVDFFAWSDMPELEGLNSLLEGIPTRSEIDENMRLLELQPQSEGTDNLLTQLRKMQDRETISKAVHYLRNSKDLTVFPTDSVIWPYPTLMRYHLFLQQEEILKGYDYVFYIDVDMRIVDTVDDDILGEGLTAAEHPMYSLSRQYIPPYEPNRDSKAFIPRLGVVVNTDGKPWFKPIYAAGGFQGGTSSSFITAMKEMRKNIDADFNNNYIAIWNDESHWNRYLYGYSGHLVVLTPSYVYPDSLINEYYVKIWGTNYKPIIITLTKKFSTSKMDGKALRDRLSSM